MKKTLILLFWLLASLGCSKSEAPDPIQEPDTNLVPRPGSPGSTTPDPPTDEGTSSLSDITQDFEFLLRNLGFPGAQVAIVWEEELVYLKAFGKADLDTGQEVTDFSRFRIGAISKPITLLALSRLIVQGRVQPNDLVFGPDGLLGTQYGTPPYEEAVMRITVDDLIEHRAGFADIPNDIMFEDPALSQADLIGQVLDQRSLAYEPGTTYTYSNFGYCLLGRIIEAVSGQSYSEYVQNEVLGPMGITGMQVSSDAQGVPVQHEVSYYTRWQVPYPLNVTRMDAHGGWLARAYDLALLAAQTDGSPNFPDFLDRGEGVSYLSRSSWGHNGALPGTTAVLKVGYPLSYVVLFNAGNSNFHETLQAVIDFMEEKTRDRTSWPQDNFFEFQ
ncbi:serine hydrolase [Robiginitalea sp. M366]|uniref:serine hydrolase domain-containing protein n=1 Tax=Robiginitalea aestuariiviva TaxID=3036903 RepID=UPI00240DE23F|nr:serine hydrolase domain-containing protein [Robiginitalea aestuariiviva]MDG1570696.1 serine hydrolase [Robiginitalea aestuariiviva]